MTDSYKQAVILDTNTIYNKWFLNTPYFKLLEIAAKQNLIEVYIPEIVLIELKSKYQKELQKIVVNIKMLLRN